MSGLTGLLAASFCFSFVTSSCIASNPMNPAMITMIPTTDSRLIAPVERSSPREEA